MDELGGIHQLHNDGVSLQLNGIRTWFNNRITTQGDP